MARALLPGSWLNSRRRRKLPTFSASEMQNYLLQVFVLFSPEVGRRGISRETKLGQVDEYFQENKGRRPTLSKKKLASYLVGRFQKDKGFKHLIIFFR